MTVASTIPAPPAEARAAVGHAATAWASVVAAAVAAGYALVPGLQALWPAHDLRGLLATALALAGAAGASRGAPPAPRPLRWTAMALLILAAATTAQDLGRAPTASGPHLGPLTGAGLVLALTVLCLTLQPLRQPLSRAAAVGVQLMLILPWAVVATALSALLPAWLLIDGSPLDSGLSWPMTLVLALLTAAATARVRRQPGLQAYFADRDDRRIFAASLALLFGAIAVAALLVAGLLTVKAIEALEPVLRHSTTAQAQALDQVVARLDAVADDAVDDLWPAAGPSPSTDLLVRRLRALRQRLDPFGQVGLRLRDTTYGVLVEGRFDESAGPRLQANAGPPISVVDRQGYVLEVERRSRRQPGADLAIQIRPSPGGASLPAAEWLGASPDAMLCSSDGHGTALCLTPTSPQGLRMPLPTRADGRPWPIQRAWAGQDGVTLLRDPARNAAMVAYAPVGSTGLGLVQKLLLAPVVQRITASVPPVLLTLLAVAAAGAGLLYRRAYPALQALRYAKAHLHAALDHLPRGVLTLDAEGRVDSSNSGARELLGLSEGALHGRPIGPLLRDRDATGPSTTPWHPHPGTSEASLSVGDGRTVPVEVLVQPFEFEGSRRQMLIVRDLRRELAQRAELARWEQIFHHADWGVAASSGSGAVLELVNPAFARLHGYTVEEVLRLPAVHLLAPQAVAELPAHLERLRASGHHRFESWHRRRDGSTFPVLIDATRAVGPDGRPLQVVQLQDISEQKRSQEAVQRSEALLQLVLKSLPVGVWIAGRDGRVVAVNPAVERLWGGTVPLRDGRPHGQRTRRLATGQPVADDDTPMQRAMRTGQATLGELIEITCADGSRRTMMTAAVPLIDADGAIQGAIAVNEDLTTLQRAEAAIVAARDFFEGLFRSAALGMAVCNANGRFERANQALCELLGRDEPSLLELAITDLGDPDGAAADRALLQGLNERGAGKAEIERRWRRADGRWVWVLIVVSAVRLPDSEQPQFTVQVLDIDRSHRIQLALQASQARLLNAHRIARLADWEWDPARDEFMLSVQGRRMLGLPADHSGLLVGTAWLARVHPSDRGRVYAALSDALRGQDLLAIDYRLLLDDGSERFLHQQGERVAGVGAEPPRLVGVLQDISERKQVENELLLSRQRLRALSANADALIEEERKHIARELHDELGQALTALKMELSLLGRRFGDDAALAAQAGRMGTMLDGTLDVVRHVVSNLRPSALDFGLVAAIEWLAEDFGLRWEMPCAVHLDGREAVLSDDRATALFRIVQESLTNVARHARAHRVDIRIACDGRLLRLSVRDDGIGFDVEAAQERGTSFGLMGQRERALKIGARLRLHSGPGTGTVVDVELPLQDPSPT